MNPTMNHFDSHLVLNNSMNNYELSDSNLLVSKLDKDKVKNNVPVSHIKISKNETSKKNEDNMISTHNDENIISKNKYIIELNGNGNYNNKEYIRYKIVDNKSKVLINEMRYSYFEKLNNCISIMFPYYVLPALPKKWDPKNNKYTKYNEEFMEKRRIKLEFYLNYICENYEEIADHSIIKKFLSLEHYANDIPSERIDILNQFNPLFKQLTFDIFTKNGEEIKQIKNKLISEGIYLKEMFSINEGIVAKLYNIKDKFINLIKYGMNINQNKNEEEIDEYEAKRQQFNDLISLEEIKNVRNLMFDLLIEKKERKSQHKLILEKVGYIHKCIKDSLKDSFESFNEKIHEENGKIDDSLKKIIEKYYELNYLESIHNGINKVFDNYSLIFSQIKEIKFAISKTELNSNLNFNENNDQLTDLNEKLENLVLLKESFINKSKEKLYKEIDSLILKMTSIIDFYNDI